MTKKHFEAIARIIEGRFDFLDLARGGVGTVDFDRGYSLATETIANELADYFATQNPNFDRQRFLVATGIYKEQS